MKFITLLHFLLLNLPMFVLICVGVVDEITENDAAG
jgi:hypothetical protein